MQVDLDDYAWAAAVATDLVNTSPGVWSGVDRLADAASLDAFLAEHGVATRGRPSTAEDLIETRALRERLHSLIDHPERDALVRGATALTGGVGGITLLTADDGRSRWAVTVPEDAGVADVLGLVCGVGVLGVVHTLGLERFRTCSAPTCSGSYIDTSRPGRRRYCTPDICGNRVNVANHRARRRTG